MMRHCFVVFLSLLVISFLASPSARAGSWTFSCTGSGNFTQTFNSSSSTTAWIPPGSSTGTSYQLSGLGSAPSRGFSSESANTTRTYDVSIQAAITLTWAPAAGQTAASDPAPPSVMLIETSTARWTAQVMNGAGMVTTGSGSADDGASDAEVATTNQGVTSGGVSATANAPAGQVPPAHWKNYAVSGGALTLNRTFSVHASANSNGFDGGAAFNIDCAFGGYSLQIHPQPYNFHQTSGTDNGDGTLSWTYAWSSTSGNLADISSHCTIYEYVSYDGNAVGTYYPGPPAAYAPPHPPLGPSSSGKISAIPNPTITPSPTVPGGPASTGSITDIQDRPYSFVASSSCVAATWTSTQTYEFDDTDTGQKGVVVPGAGPMTITRSVYPVGSPPSVPQWYYTVNKSGITSMPLFIP